MGEWVRGRKVPRIHHEWERGEVGSWGTDPSFSASRVYFRLLTQLINFQESCI